MLQIFSDFKSPKDFLQEPYKCALQGDFSAQNLLIFDDNLNAMQFLIQKKGLQKRARFNLYRPAICDKQYL